MFGQAIARLRVGVVRQEARRDAQPLGGRDARLGRRPVLERSLVGLVRLGEPQRRVQGERELEEDERDLLALAAPLEQRQQVAVVVDRLVERVLVPRLVAGPQQVVDGLLLVLGREPVVREQAEHLVVAVLAYRSSSHSAAAPVQARRRCSASSVR